jgi:hypothetical protein
VAGSSRRPSVFARWYANRHPICRRADAILSRWNAALIEAGNVTATIAGLRRKLRIQATAGALGNSAMAGLSLAEGRATVTAS